MSRAPECGHGHGTTAGRCYEDACIIVDEKHFVCATHARDIASRRGQEHAEAFPGVLGMRVLFKPLVDVHVILRDIEKPKGLIIVPKTALDRHGRVKGTVEDATGIILRSGPGYQQRKGAWGLSGLHVSDRKPMYAQAGWHVTFRAKYENAVGEWRGLALVHDFDVLGELIPEAKDTAAQ